MKRFLVPLALAIALALPAQALAGVETYTGPISPSGSVILKVKKTDGTPTKVNSFTFLDLPVTCEDGEDTPSGRYPLEGNKSTATIKNKKFKISAGEVDTGAGLEVRGTVSRKRAFGTIELAGDTPEHSNCASGVLDWTATR